MMPPQMPQQGVPFYYTHPMASQPPYPAPGAYGPPPYPQGMPYSSPQSAPPAPAVPERAQDDAPKPSAEPPAKDKDAQFDEKLLGSAERAAPKSRKKRPRRMYSEVD
jgi:hypothetical protein